ncbi:hypothetical protein [Amphritea sp.]|uniref:hypothetical protein n=1 Tax=Amphritea sp. TaxID=1872502 RepID=UPI003D0BBAA3
MSDSLLQQAQRITQSALKCGALLPVGTVIETVVEAPFTFQLRTLSSLHYKENDQRIRQAANHSANPFKPYDPQLYVGDIGAGHICLLNKFNVIENHLLLVTREFEPQTSLLSPADFKAALLGLSEVDGLIFFNGGREAGASQPHKHLQLIPITPSDLPLAEQLNRFSEQPESNPHLPFNQAGIQLPTDITEDIEAGSLWLYRRYLTLLDYLRISHTQGQAEAAYNLLLCRNSLMLVPRSAESFASVSFNALAFCGALLVKNATQANALKAAGIANALSSAT